jgi:5S rRNA maturation endonuclease (ribonuclease M5)
LKKDLKAQCKKHRSGWWGKGGKEVAQTMYTHVSKCKNSKINERKKKKMNHRSGEKTLGEDS